MEIERIKELLQNGDMKIIAAKAMVSYSTVMKTFSPTDNVNNAKVLKVAEALAKRREQELEAAINSVDEITQ
jgi:DNA-binding phage protein